MDSISDLTWLNDQVHKIFSFKIHFLKTKCKIFWIPAQPPLPDLPSQPLLCFFLIILIFIVLYDSQLLPEILPNRNSLEAVDVAASGSELIGNGHSWQNWQIVSCVQNVWCHVLNDWLYDVLPFQLIEFCCHLHFSCRLHDNKWAKVPNWVKVTS